MPEINNESANSSETVMQDNDLSQPLRKSINKIIQNEGYVSYSVDIRKICTSGENYMSNLMHVDIKGRTVSKNKETNLFIKQSLPENGIVFFSSRDLLLREIFIYEELANVFDKLQKEFNVPEEDQFYIIKCYGDEASDSLILENMTKKGFKTYNRLGVMPIKALKLALAQIAKFHALSLVIKKLRPDYFKSQMQNYTYPFNFHDGSTKFLLSLCDFTLDILEGDTKKKLEKYLDFFLEKHYRYLNKNEGKIKCFCHGDFRMNNVLVKESNNEAKMAIPVDFQAIFYGSPLIDILYIIFTSTNQEMRKNEMENLKSTYFESLSKFLKYFNIDVESLYPRKEFDEDFKSQLDFGLIMSLIALPYILAAEDDVPKIELDVKKRHLDDSFKPRIQGLIDDFIQWGYL